MDIPADEISHLSVNGLSRRKTLQLLGAVMAMAGLGLPSRGAAADIGSGQMATLAAMAETIIPRTDTPGAIDAGVPQVLSLLFQRALSAPHRAALLAVIDEVEHVAQGKLGRPFHEAPGVDQHQIMAAFDASNRSDAAYARLKGLILSAYYLSEPGATIELRFEEVPGAWEPRVVMNADTRTWAI